MTIPSWTDPELREPGDYAYGNTVGVKKNMEILAQNQQYFAGDDGTGTYNAGSAVAHFYNPCMPADGYEYGLQNKNPIAFIRRFNLLVYRAKGAVLRYGNPKKPDDIRSVTLDDITQEGDCGVVDLAAIPGLHVGMFYWIEIPKEEGTSEVGAKDDETEPYIAFAWEWPDAPWSPTPLMGLGTEVMLASELED